MSQVRKVVFTGSTAIGSKAEQSVSLCSAQDSHFNWKSSPAALPKKAPKRSPAQAVSRQVMEACAKGFKRLLLELGGAELRAARALRALKVVLMGSGNDPASPNCIKLWCRFSRDGFPCSLTLTRIVREDCDVEKAAEGLFKGACLGCDCVYNKASQTI